MRNPLDISIVRRHAVLRKGMALAMRPVGNIQATVMPAGSWQTRPPIIVHSLPKSGTHLLLQQVRAVPGGRYLGRFIASSPSISQKTRHPQAIVRRLRSVAPGERVGGHLFHSENLVQTLRERNFVSLFICRDPRDVLISELHYLTEMNRWHRMHGYFKRLPDFSDRLSLALYGMDDRYPECNKRFLPYAGWMKSKGTLVVRYEALIGPDRDDVLREIIARFKIQGGFIPDAESVLSAMNLAGDPSTSHTFREGGIGKWRRGLADQQAEEITECLAPSLSAFGYVD